MQKDLNNAILGTYSQKLSKIVPIKNFMCKKIDEVQDIRRLCRYIDSLSPLDEKGITYGNEFIGQPDLKDSLMSIAKKDKHLTKNGKEKVLIPYNWSISILNERQMNIYVYHPMTTFSSYSYRNGVSIVGEHTFMVDIVYPIELNELVDGHERALSIACRILDLFDGYTIDEPEFVEQVGNVSFEIKEDSIIDDRLGSTKYGCLTIPFRVSTIGKRTDKSYKGSTL